MVGIFLRISQLRKSRCSANVSVWQVHQPGIVLRCGTPLLDPNSHIPYWKRGLNDEEISKIHYDGNVGSYFANTGNGRQRQRGIH